MELDVINIINSNKVSKKIKVSPVLFDNKFNEALIHQIITSYLSNSRIAIKAQKNRSEVRGGGIKPFRQKGTGKARAGSIRSPIWRGGGKTFTDRERNYKKKMNKKMYKIAIKSVFSELIRQKRLIIIDNFVLNKPKTKDIILKINSLNIVSGLLIVYKYDKNIYLSIKNVPNFYVKNIDNINPIILIKNKNIIITIDALKKLEDVLR